MWKQIVNLISVIFITRVLSLEGPVVTTSDGKIQGTWENSMHGRRYSAFQGIPYAKPPESSLRFEEPVPIEPWDGIWQATTPYTCSQIKPSTDIHAVHVIIGEEDCLYLNVYIPGEKIDQNKSYDVLVEIHGGAFMSGSPTQMINPPYVLDTMEDMILVLINYRLGIFGFLSTEDDAIPGNNGMKDQVLALKWVKKNIGYFGGNPDSVTVSAHSAGAACAHLHTLSPLSRGLFQKAHIGSGSAFNPSMIKEKPLESAKKLAALAGCPTKATQALKQCLKTRPASLLLSFYNQFYPYKSMPFSPFAVVVETGTENPFLPKLPYELVKEGHIADIPLIFSTVRDEGLFPTGYYCRNPEEIEPVWKDEAHYLLDYNYTLPLEDRADLAQKIKDLYMGPGAVINQDSFFRFTEIFSDRYYTIATEMAAKLHSVATKSPVYFFYFDYKSPNLSSSALYCNKGDIGGVAHSADQLFFFGYNMTKFLSRSDQEITNKCHQMYSSFAKTGVPSFNGSGIWRPTKGDYLLYLNISGPDDITMRRTMSLSHYPEFWRKHGLAENERDVFPNVDPSNSASSCGHCKSIIAWLIFYQFVNN